MALFICRERFFRTNGVSFEHFTFSSENEKTIEMLKKNYYFNKNYKLWDRTDVTPPINEIPREFNSFSWEYFDELVTKKIEKELFAGEDYASMVEKVITDKYNEVIEKFMRSNNVKVKGHSKLELREQLIYAVRNNKISKERLADFYTKGDKYITEEEYLEEKAKEVSNGDNT